MLKPLGLVAAMTSALLGGSMASAHADGGLGGATCDTSSCQETAGSLGSTPASSAPAHRTQSNGPVCFTTPYLTPELAKVVDERKGKGPQVEYHQVCVLADGQASVSRLVLASKSSGAAAKSLAEQAYKNVTMPEPEVVMSPAAGVPQLTGLPVWLWLRPGSWVPVSSSVSAGGVTVTATARPQRVVWSMGDGSTVRCAGPGTPYPAGQTDPMASSPDCGYTYRRTSAHEPGGTFGVAVTIVWRVDWSGFGPGGSFPDVESSVRVSLKVIEAAALVTSGRG